MYVPSLITSRHQNDIERTTDTKAKIKNVFALLKPCIVKAPVVVNVNNAILVNIGQGDGDTK
jgi:predicted neuraminidase